MIILKERSSGSLEPIFIIGCARSGTTIFGECFKNNSQCIYLHEKDIWKKYTIANKIFRFMWGRTSNPTSIRTMHYKITKILRNLRLMKSSSHVLTADNVTSKMVERVEQFMSNLGNKRLVVKHPRNSLKIPFILKVFPNAKFVHIIRDGRDVTCSLMEPQGSGYWAHIKPLGWEYWQDNYPKGPIKYAWQWNTVINIINSEKEKIPKDNFVEIHYEDFVSNPEKTIRFIFEKFAIPFEKPQKDLCKLVQNEMKDSYIAGEKYVTYDHAKRIGRYKENLTREELIDVERILGKSNAKYNYT